MAVTEYEGALTSVNEAGDEAVMFPYTKTTMFETYPVSSSLVEVCASTNNGATKVYTIGMPAARISDYPRILTDAGAGAASGTTGLITVVKINDTKALIKIEADTADGVSFYAEGVYRGSTITWGSASVIVMNSIEETNEALYDIMDERLEERNNNLYAIYAGELDVTFTNGVADLPIIVNSGWADVYNQIRSVVVNGFGFAAPFVASIVSGSPTAPIIKVYRMDEPTYTGTAHVSAIVYATK